VAEGARFWDRDRYEYHVAYVLPWKSDLVADLETQGVPTMCIGGERGLSPTSLLHMRTLIRNLRADVVHAHSPSVGIAARLVSSVPIVYTEHNLASSYRPLTQVANRLTYGRNNAVTAVSQAVADSLVGYPGPTPIVISNGVSVDVEKLNGQGARSELGIDEGRPMIVHVGNVRPGKGHDTLTRAVAFLTKRFPDCAVVSVGGEKYPGDLDRYRRLAESSGVADSLHFVGRRADALDFIAAADVYVNPSDVEGLPVSILEAMYLQKPIVATGVGGVPAVIRDRETGLLVAPGDAVALAEAVAELLGNAELRTELGTAARSLVVTEYSLQSMVAAFENIYEDVANG